METREQHALQQHEGADGQLRRWTLFSFALPAVPISALGLPLLVHLPPFYAVQMELGFSIVGILFMIARFWDVFTDPVLGIVSDRVESRWGRRRHWIGVSTPIIMLAVVMIFMPPEEVSAFYLLFWLLFLYVGWTLLTISHMSWGAELSPLYHERSRVQSAREVALILGMVFVLLLPLLVEQVTGASGRNVTVSFMGWFIVLLLPFTVLVAVTRVSERKNTVASAMQGSAVWKNIRQDIARMFREFSVLLGRSIPLRKLLAVDLVSGISTGIVAGLFLFLARDVLKLEESWSSLMLIVYFISGAAFIPLVLMISRWLGKHRAASLSAIFSGFSTLLILAVPAEAPGLALLCWSFLGLNMAAGPVLFRAMMADIAEDDAVHTGEPVQRTGLFFSFLTMTQKVGYALAIGLGYVALDMIGFKAGAANTPGVLWSIRLIYVVPVFFIAIWAAWVLWYFPLDEEQQEKNRKALAVRRSSTVAVPPDH